MSKLICDVCGTAYPETATQCPICGCVRPGNIGAINSPEGGQQSESGYQFVKGGRFSKANVKKRNQGKVYAPEDSIEHITGKSSNRGLIIAIIILFIAIAAVGAYIVITFLSRREGPSNVQPSESVVSTAPSKEQANTVETKPSVIECTKIEISRGNGVYTFEEEGSGVLLEIKKTPENTTEELEFYTSDENVATVSPKGMVTAVGYGQAIITVKCGKAETTVSVSCEFNKPKEPTEPSVVVDPEMTFEFETYTGALDIQFSYKGERADIYVGTVPVDQIVWTSDDEKVATFIDGVVTATGEGKTEVHAKYGDQEMTCIVRCTKGVGPYTEPVVEAPPPEVVPEYVVNVNEKTIAVGEEFKLIVTDRNGAVVNVDWTVENTGICSISGNTIRGIGTGVVMVSAVCDGFPLACTVTVK